MLVVETQSRDCGTISSIIILFSRDCGNYHDPIQPRLRTHPNDDVCHDVEDVESRPQRIRSDGEGTTVRSMIELTGENRFSGEARRTIGLV